jgi:hypothetical protein
MQDPYGFELTYKGPCKPLHFKIRNYSLADQHNIIRKEKVKK